MLSSRFFYCIILDISSHTIYQAFVNSFWGRKNKWLWEVRQADKFVADNLEDCENNLVCVCSIFTWVSFIKRLKTFKQLQCEKLLKFILGKFTPLSLNLVRGIIFPAFHRNKTDSEPLVYEEGRSKFTQWPLHSDCRRHTSLHKSTSLAQGLQLLITEPGL